MYLKICLKVKMYAKQARIQILANPRSKLTYICIQLQLFKLGFIYLKHV